MHGNKLLMVVAILVGVGIIAIIAYYVARFMRGTIKLSLPRTAFNPGDTITGSFDLHVKKAMEGNQLIVSLIGTQTNTTNQNGKAETHSREIYRDVVLVEAARNYPAGHRETHEFGIATPQTQTPEFLNTGVGQALTSAVRFLSHSSTRLRWKIEARLDAKGIDLAATKAVSININELI